MEPENHSPILVSRTDITEGFDQWLKKYRVRSTLILVLASWMMYDASRWGMWFAVDNTRNGMEIAAILAAIQTPATVFAGWAFKIYQETKFP